MSRREHICVNGFLPCPQCMAEQREEAWQEIKALRSRVRVLEEALRRVERLASKGFICVSTGAKDVIFRQITEVVEEAALSKVEETAK